jgi:hypothetical protein
MSMSLIPYTMIENQRWRRFRRFSLSFSSAFSAVYF